MLQQLSETIRAANAAGRALRIRGGGTKDFYGGPLRGEPLDVRSYRGVVDYEPTELVITVRAGTPLAEVEEVLRQQGQMLAFEPPHFDQLPPSPPAPPSLTPDLSPKGGEEARDALLPSGEGTGMREGSIERSMPETKMATLGGCIAAGLSGPRRMYAGAARDLVLGIRLMDGEGADLQFGGRVMKNVAGFDVSRVIAGSLGTLGVILEASLKVLPLPKVERTVVLELSERKALETMNRWAALPVPISATAYFDNRLHVRLSGAAPGVDAACGKLGGSAIGNDEARALWSGLREHAHPYFRSDEALWRLALPSTTPPLDLPGRTLIEWGGALRWMRGDVSASTVREAAARHGGHATLFRNGDKAVGVFQPLTPVLLGIHRRLKHALDPAGIFNRGRLYPDF